MKKAKTAAKSAVKKKASEKAPIGNLDAYRRRLEEMRDDLNRTVRKKQEEVEPEAEVGDEADVAVRSVQRDLVFELNDNERHMLEEVEAALRRMEKGTFGFCEACSEKIAMLRLKAMPYARYCIKCQSRFESI